MRSCVYYAFRFSLGGRVLLAMFAPQVAVGCKAADSRGDEVVEYHAGGPKPSELNPNSHRSALAVGSASLKQIM
ncbi:hypothetical protein [Candidatus Nitrospira salsa]